MLTDPSFMTKDTIAKVILTQDTQQVDARMVQINLQKLIFNNQQCFVITCKDIC